jgi:HNH endonuclease
MEAALKKLVRQRANGRCEYCRLPEFASGIPFEADHIRALHHKGPTTAANLAHACIYCNGYKGPNASGFDPLTGKLTQLFNPRRHKWSYHFHYDGGELTGQTAVGRTTIEVLRINLPNRVALRELLMEDGLF